MNSEADTIRIEDLRAAQRKAERTYNAAADCFDAEPLAFWNRYGRRTVDRLPLRDGASVLDACCGAGASALPAARAVGPRGTVVAVDLAERLLELGRKRADAAGVSNIEFRRADMTALGFPDGHFDAVVCVFGIFFVPDMEAQLAELWRMLRPGGRLAVTTWGPDFFAPVYDIWHAAVGRVRTDLRGALDPWDRITTTAAVRRLFVDAGIDAVDVVPEAGHQALTAPEDFWTIARGSGLRGTIDDLDAGSAKAVRQDILDAIAARKIDSVQTNVIYVVAAKPVSTH